jgi:hypothetical protein
MRRRRRLASAAIVAPASPKLFEQRFASRRCEIVFLQGPGQADHLTDLVEIGGAASAGIEVALNPLVLGRRERVLEVVGDEFDEL